MGGSPKNTGTKSQYGRVIWESPSGEMYSEKTATIQAPDGKWYNIPTVGAHGEIMNPVKVQRLYEVTGRMNDFLTGLPLQPFDDLASAEAAAKARSSGIKGN